MGAELKAEAMSHLEEISVEGMRQMGQSKSVAVILPTTGKSLFFNNKTLILKKNIHISLSSSLETPSRERYD